MTKVFSVTTGAALLLLAVSGCADLGIQPPFDATGYYRGTWQGTVQGASGGERTCSVSFDLNQDTTYHLLQGFALAGTATVYFSCASMIDDIAENGLPSRVVLDVEGFLLPDGHIAFASVSPDTAQFVTIAVAGTGRDGDDNGTMDEIEANWTLVIDQTDHPRITVTGDVTAASV